MQPVDIIMIAWSPNESRMAMMRQTIDSLRENTTVQYRLIVVDNGPCEQTEYLRTIAPDMHVVSNINQGPAESRNIGARLATAKYIVYLDNDLTFDKGWLAESVKMLETYPKHKLIVAPSRSTPMRKASNSLGTMFGWQAYRVVAGFCLVMARSAFAEIGPWTYGSCNIEDRHYMNRAFDAGYVMLNWPEGPQVQHAGRKQKTFDPINCDFKNGKWIKRK